MKDLEYHKDGSNGGCIIPLWPIFVIVLLTVGDPDLLDAIIRFVGGYT